MMSRSLRPFFLVSLCLGLGYCTQRLCEMCWCFGACCHWCNDWVVGWVFCYRYDTYARFQLFTMSKGARRVVNFVPLRPAYKSPVYRRTVKVNGTVSLSTTPVPPLPLCLGYSHSPSTARRRLPSRPTLSGRGFGHPPRGSWAVGFCCCRRGGPCPWRSSRDSRR